MNRTAYAALFLLPLIACGTEGTSASDTTGNVAIGQNNDALNVSSFRMSSARKQDIIASYSALPGDVFTAVYIKAGLAPDAAVTVIDVTGMIESARTSSTREIWVPAGTVAAPKDPNMAREFYVAVHTNDGSNIYGPFEVRAQEGSTCGSTLAGALPACADGLRCAVSTSPDAPGVCQAN